MLKNILARVVVGEDLSRADAEQAMDIIMSGQASEAQIGAFLTALRIKGETSAEIAGFATVMRKNAAEIQCHSPQVIDSCGTGGDHKGTFNVSTTVAFVLAGAGLTVAKHGNRGVSSACGSSDVLAALGVNIDLPPQAVAKIINEIHIAFLFAPLFHQAMKYAAKPRKELGFRTVFNLLGPLTNPACATCQVIGVYDQALIRKIAEAVQELGVSRAMVVSSDDGMDEISTLAPTKVVEVVGSELREYMIDPKDYGFTPGDESDFQGGNAQENAAIVRGILEGQHGPKRDLVLINAAAALMVADKVSSLQAGINMAAASIDTGAALGKLEALKEFSNKSEEELLSL
jgi:anthranilate phosphoribosyltransferase